MADGTYTTKQLLVLRKLTRAVADLVRGQLKDHLATLGFLLWPKNVFGEFAGGAKDYRTNAELALKDLQTAYEAMILARPFNLPKSLPQPLEVISSAAELTPLEYVHQAKTDSQQKTVTITAPLKFILSYSGFGPKRLKELLAGPITGREVQEFVVHTLMLNVVMARQTGLARILDGLHFSVSTGRLPNFGQLPFTFVTAGVPTLRPPDDVIIESTEISGTDTFEEVINVDELAAQKDPFHERLMELVRSHGVGVE